MELISNCRQAVVRVQNSRWFIPIQLVLAAAAIVFKQNAVGSMLLLAASVLMLIFSDDTLSALCPVMLIVMAVTSFYDNYYALAQYWWAAIPVAAALIVHFCCYRHKFTRGRLLLPYAAVSGALILGGIGTISKEEYFSPVALYYVLGLGAALLLIYALITPRLAAERGYDLTIRFAALVYSMAVLAVILIIMFYVDRWARLVGSFHTPFISYRNFCTTVMLFGMPMTCLFIKKNKLHFIGMAFIFFGMLLGGSRSGLLFGSVELVMCLAYIYTVSPEERRSYRIIAAVCALPVLALGLFMVNKLYLGDSGRMSEHFVRPTEARVSFYPQGVRDFLDKPILGWGIGNMKNLDIYQGVNGSISFYHNAVLQVLASMGVIGGAAYLWQFAKRAHLLWEKRSAPCGVFAISFAAVLLMSQTNPGLFCPLPTALLMMLMFAVAENSKENAA